MSIVPASSKTIANRNMSEGKSKDSPECSEIKLISKPPIKICLGVNKNLLLQKNNKSIIQLKTNPPPNSRRCLPPLHLAIELALTTRLSFLFTGYRRNSVETGTCIDTCRWSRFHESLSVSNKSHSQLPRCNIHLTNNSLLSAASFFIPT